MADFVAGQYIVKGPKEKLDYLYKIMKDLQGEDRFGCPRLSDLESVLKNVKAHPMPAEANFPMLYSPKETKPHLEDGEVESAFCGKDNSMTWNALKMP